MLICFANSNRQLEKILAFNLKIDANAWNMHSFKWKLSHFVNYELIYSKINNKAVSDKGCGFFVIFISLQLQWFLSQKHPKLVWVAETEMATAKLLKLRLYKLVGGIRDALGVEAVICLLCVQSESKAVCGGQACGWVF